jgi:uncharacterized protein
MAELIGEVLIVGASTRGLAESAARAGYRVHAVDAYGDVDLVERAHTIALRRDLGIDWSPSAAVAAAASIGCSTLAYTSNLENHPSALARLAAGRQLWGNPPGVLRRVRDPFHLAEALRNGGFRMPAVSAAEPSETGRSGAWLLKPRRSGGGHGIRPWRLGDPVPRTRYLQERVEGPSGSIAFVADGRRAVPLGLSLQLPSQHAFGAAGFRYCGSLLCGGPDPLFVGEPALAESAAAMAAAVTEGFGLVGVNGIDFVARDGVPWAVEVNPRYSASMELVEEAHSVSIFRLHAEACSGRLPSEGPFGRPLGQVHGKAVLYAREPVIAGQLRQHGALRDVPHPGERIGRGRPICTVLAEGETAAACLDALEARAAWVYHTGTAAARSAA